jgi:alkylation response protein AidB-like acyl-CoA dehydrogenase
MSGAAGTLQERESATQSAPGLNAELAAAAEALEQSLAAGSLSHFYKVFRSTSLPFLCGEYKDDAGRLFPACFDVVHRLGSISPAAGLAVENHYYVTSAIATFPTHGDALLERKRAAILDAVVEGRLLVANTNSKVHTPRIGEIGTKARREGSGFQVSGTAVYTSLASEADLLVLMTELEGSGFAVFAIEPMQGNPAIEIGPYLFPAAMIDSDTRRITFHNLELPESALIATAEQGLARYLFPFEMAWHQVLIPALYLGAAAGAIEEARAFLTTARGRDGNPLAALDGMVTDMGRLAIEYRAAMCAVEKAGEALAGVRQLPRDAEQVDRALGLAGVAKYVGTRSAESIVTAARRIVGARAFGGGCALERISQEVMFASLGPEVSAVLERRAGKQALEAHSFLDVAR